MHSLLSENDQKLIKIKVNVIAFSELFATQKLKVGESKDVTDVRVGNNTDKGTDLETFGLEEQSITLSNSTLVE